jgi:hypothetical protein
VLLEAVGGEPVERVEGTGLEVGLTGGLALLDVPEQAGGLDDVVFVEGTDGVELQLRLAHRL